MYSVNADTKNAYKSDSSHKELEVRIPDANIVLTNEDIVTESLELKEAIENSGLRIAYPSWSRSPEFR